MESIADQMVTRELSGTCFCVRQEEVRCKFGFLGHGPGQGKTREVCRFLASAAPPPRDDQFVDFASSGMVRITNLMDLRVIGSSVIVAPKYLFEYWSQTLTQEGVPFMTVTDRLSTADCHHIESGEYRVILTSSKGYNIVTNWARNVYKFARVVFDEPQHIHLPCCDQLMASFYWLVSCEAPELIGKA